MSHINVELHEKYVHEHIGDWEHGVVREEMQAIGFFPRASQGGVEQHLPRGCYFNENGSKVDIDRAYQNIKSRLGREVSMEATLGSSHGYGLKPVAVPDSFFMSTLPLGSSSVPGFNALSDSKDANFSQLLGLMGELKLK
jgi:hypothetical protein